MCMWAWRIATMISAGRSVASSSSPLVTVLSSMREELNGGKHGLRDCERMLLLSANVRVPNCLIATKSTYRSVTTAAMAEMKTKANQQYFAVIYDYVPDILEKRGQYRTEHLGLANQMVDEGKMLMGGAWGSPIDGALMLFCVHDVGEVHAFVEKDPYVRNGLVTKVDIRPYAVVVGALVRS